MKQRYDVRRHHALGAPTGRHEILEIEADGSIVPHVLGFSLSAADAHFIVALLNVTTEEQRRMALGEAAAVLGSLEA